MGSLQITAIILGVLDILGLVYIILRLIMLKKGDGGGNGGGSKFCAILPLASISVQNGSMIAIVAGLSVILAGEIAYILFIEISRVKGKRMTFGEDMEDIKKLEKMDGIKITEISNEDVEDLARLDGVSPEKMVEKKLRQEHKDDK